MPGKKTRNKRLKSYSLVKGSKLIGNTCFLLLLMALFNSTPSYGQKTVATWQTSWEAFVQAHNKCIQDPACKLEKFLGKDVTWEGQISQNDTIKHLIILDMAGSPIQDKAGTAADKFGLHLQPEIAQQAKWKEVTKGQLVRFHAKVQKELDYLGGFVMFMNAGPGNKIAILVFENGELIKILPGK